MPLVTALKSMKCGLGASGDDARQRRLAHAGRPPENHGARCWSCSISRRRTLPSPSRCSWPTNSSRVRGRSRAGQRLSLCIAEKCFLCHGSSLAGYLKYFYYRACPAGAQGRYLGKMVWKICKQCTIIRNKYAIQSERMSKVMERVLAGLAPERVWHYFEEISAIPRGIGQRKRRLPITWKRLAEATCGYAAYRDADAQRH